MVDPSPSYLLIVISNIRPQNQIETGFGVGVSRDAQKPLCLRVSEIFDLLACCVFPDFSHPKPKKVPVIAVIAKLVYKFMKLLRYIPRAPTSPNSFSVRSSFGDPIHLGPGGIFRRTGKARVATAKFTIKNTCKLPHDPIQSLEHFSGWWFFALPL